LGLPTKLDALHTNEEDTVWNLIDRTAIGGMQSGDLPFHAAPSFWPG
jgi:hypothetical protein